MPNDGDLLTCDRTHARHYGDRDGRYWSVSQVLSVLSPPAPVSPEMLQRGKDLHTIFALRLAEHAGRASAPCVPDHYRLYDEAMVTWIKTVNPVLIECETPHKHGRLPYAGTPDAVVRIQDVSVLLELKSGVPQRTHAVQVMAYWHLLPDVRRAMIIYLSPAGIRTVTLQRDARHWAAFQNALAVLLWRDS